MVTRVARDIEHMITKQSSQEELNEVLTTIRAQIGSIVVQESKAEKLSAMSMVGKTYTECLYQHLVSQDINSVDGTATMCYVMFLMGLLDVKETGQYGIYDPCSPLKYFILDTLTAGEYLRMLVKGILSYNSVGVVLAVDYDLDVLLGNKPGKQEITVEMVRVGDACVVKFITIHNPLTGGDSIEDCLTLLSDGLCLLYAPTGLRFLRDCYFAGKREIVYSKTRSLPVRFNIYGSEQGTEYYKSIHSSLYVEGDGEYTPVPRYCNNAAVYKALRSTNNNFNVITRSTTTQGFYMGKYDGATVTNPQETATIKQSVI